MNSLPSYVFPFLYRTKFKSKSNGGFLVDNSLGESNNSSSSELASRSGPKLNFEKSSFSGTGIKDSQESPEYLKKVKQVLYAKMKKIVMKIKFG